jgi:hypothetical protein
MELNGHWAVIWWDGRSHWQLWLKRGSAAARLLGFWVRILLEACTSLSCGHCVLTGRGLLSSPTECGMYDCNLETPMMRSWPTRPAEPWKKIYALYSRANPRRLWAPSVGAIKIWYFVSLRVAPSITAVLSHTHGKAGNHGTEKLHHTLRGALLRVVNCIS